MEDCKSSKGLSIQRVNLFQYLAADLPFHRNGGAVWNILVLIINHLQIWQNNAWNTFCVDYQFVAFFVLLNKAHLPAVLPEIATAILMLKCRDITNIY